MLKIPHKSLLIALLLLLSCSQIAHAQKRLYQDGSNMPFVQMMLSMMAAMGLIDRMPANGRYSGFGQPNMSNSYMRALTIQGLPPGSSQSGFANNPFLRTQWLQTPWSLPAMDGANVNSASPIWGTPSWGVLPTDRYSPNNYDPYRSSSVWSESDRDGWVNESWETSLWNPDAGVKSEVPVQTTRQPKMAQSIDTSAQNFSYNMPAEVKRNKSQARSQQTLSQQTQGRQMDKSPSPLSKLMQTDRSQRPSPEQLRQPDRESAPVMARQPMEDQTMAGQQNKASPLHKKTRQSIRQKPCITEFCGLKKPNLNGLWVAQNGEMMGIKNKRYLWSDGKARQLTGQLLIQNEYLLTSVDGHKKTMRFKYKLAGNHLLTMQPDGAIREFVRMPNKQNFAQQYY